MSHPRTNAADRPFAAITTLLAIFVLHSEFDVTLTESKTVVENSERCLNERILLQHQRARLVSSRPGKGKRIWHGFNIQDTTRRRRRGWMDGHANTQRTHTYMSKLQAVRGKLGEFCTRIAFFRLL